MDDTTHEGGCACGAVRYRAEGEPIFVNNCHCRLCQRQTGSTSVVNAFFERECVTVSQGELTEHTLKSGSATHGILLSVNTTAVGVISPGSSKLPTRMPVPRRPTRG